MTAHFDLGWHLVMKVSTSRCSARATYSLGSSSMPLPLGSILTHCPVVTLQWPFAINRLSQIIYTTSKSSCTDWNVYNHSCTFHNVTTLYIGVTT